MKKPAIDTDGASALASQKGKVTHYIDEIKLQKDFMPGCALVTSGQEAVLKRITLFARPDQ